ncbi:MAG: isoprenoid biosynthesis glyoxalase ElbB [Bacteroidales bacterium]|nr:isoprenoid biosynthesis glyoxalase ElbB [Bacteroidales bacterium]
MMICFAIVLSGCGVYDGSEIGEAMMTMLALDEAGCRYEIFAPDKPQFHVVDHLKGEPASESRNVLAESARIARGKIRPLSEYKAENYSGLIFPGGFGAAKNLCTFAFDGASMTVDAEVERAVNETRQAGKPIGAMCIAPVILGKLIAGVQVTVGHDEATNEALRQMGAEPKNVFGPDVVHDTKNKVFTTPCYMLPDATISTVAACCRNLVAEMLK